MANIKKFDQEIRIIGNGVSMGDILTGLTSASYGKFYSHSSEPWFANESLTWKLADATDLVAVSSQTWANVTDITNLSSQTWTNVTDIATLSAGTFEITDGTTASDIGFDGSITLIGGTDITISNTGGVFTISNVAAASANYYLTGASFTTTTASASEVTFDVKDYGGVALDLHKKMQLDNLSGVSTTGVADGDFLIYNSSTLEWEATGITDDTLIPGTGITFDTNTPGQVIISSNITATSVVWVATDGTNSGNITMGDTVQISGGSGVDVTYDAATSAYTIDNTSTAAIVSITATSGLTDYGTATDPIIGHINSNTISNNITSLYVNDYGIDAYGHVSSVTPRDLTNNLDARYVNIDGDTMTGDLTIGSTGTNANLTVNGNTTLNGNLYVSGTTTSIDVENLTISDNIITVNSGEPTAGVSNGSAGIVVDRGTSSAYTFVFEETTDTFRIGETTSDASATTIETSHTQAVATRADTITANSFLFWNNTEKRIDGITAAPTSDQIALYDGSDWTYTDLTSATGIYSWNTISGDTGSITTSSVNDSMTIAGGNMIETVAGTSTLTINHSASTYTAPATATNEFITSLTVDAYGHITAASNTAIDFTDVLNTSQFLTASTNYFAIMSADTGSYDASSTEDTFTIVGGTGIDTSISGSILTISSDNSELLYSQALGGTSTTLTDTNTTNKKVAIIDYYVGGYQEGQIRYVIGEDFTHDFQGSLNISILSIANTSTKIVLTHTSSTADITYFIKYII